MANVLSTTLTALRQGLLEYIGEWVGNPASADGVSGGTTIVDATNLVRFAPDYFNTQFALLTSGTYSGQIRAIKDFVQSTGTVTVLSAYGGQVLSGVTYELCPYHPIDDVRWAINEAIKECYPYLGRHIINDDLISGNWLPNGSMRDWDVASAPNKWALVGAGASAAQTTIATRNWPAVGLTRAGTDCYVHCSETQWPALIDLGGSTVDFEAWVLSSVANMARLSIYVNDVSVATSSYHTGGGALELLKIDNYSITDSPNKISFRCEGNGANGQGQFTRIRVIGPDINYYLMPLAFSQAEAQRVSIQTFGTEHGDERPCDDLGEVTAYQTWEGATSSYDDALGAWLLRFMTRPSVGRKIRLEGMEYMSTVSVEADTVPLDAPQALLLYIKAAQRLFERKTRKSTGRQQAEYQAKADAEEKKYKELRHIHGFSRPVLVANYGRWRHAD